MKTVIRGMLAGAALLGNLTFGATAAQAKAGLRYSPHGLKFGKQAFHGVGQGSSSTSAPQTISISNTGPAITGLNIQLSGSDQADFQIFQKLTTCRPDFGLGTGAGCTVAVTFTPARSGRRTATLMLSDASNSSAGAVKLSGIGVETHPLITPPELDFGKVQVGTTSPPKTITVKNPNKIAVSIQSIATSGPFAVSGKPTCGSSLGAGKSCQIVVTFTPTPACNGTLETGTLTVANDAAGAPARTNLTGIAIRNAQMAIFLTNTNSNSVTAYAQSSAGNSAPIVTFGDPYGQRPGAVAVDSNGNVYAPNQGDNSVSVYAACADGSITPTAPTATIKGPDTGLSGPDGVALDASGKNIYVTNYGPGFGLGFGTITVYPALSGGDVKPIATIGGVNTELANPDGIALDSSGNIYVANYQISSSGSITVYPPLGTSTGALDEAPSATIIGSNTGLVFPTGIALDSLGNIYVSNQFGPSGKGSVTIYAAAAISSGGGNVSPVATISGADTGMDEADGVAVDSTRNVYVANPFNSSITIYSAAEIASGGGDLTAIATITGPATQLQGPDGITLASSGSIYVADSAGAPSGLGAVRVYPPLGSGTGTLNEMPTATFSASDAGVLEPEGIALDSQGNIYLANGFGATGGCGSIAAYTAMAVSGVSGSVAPIAIISGPDTGINTPLGISLDSTGNIYVANNGGCGLSALGPSITIYPPLGNSTGIIDEAPTATIAGSNTGLLSILGIAADTKGDIFVANPAGGPSNLGSIEVFQPPGSGLQNEAPSSTITGVNTGLSFPESIALDPKANVYVVNIGVVEGRGGPPSVTIYSAAEVNSGGNVSPIATITGANTELISPTSIALDPSGKIYVASLNLTAQGQSGGSVLVYPPLGSSTGTLDEAPIVTITGPSTLIDGPSGIAIGPFAP